MLARNLSRTSFTAVILGFACLVALPTHAQLTYDLTHEFTWTPAPTFPPAALEVTGREFAHVWVSEPGHRVSEVAPAQGALFDPFGKENFDFKVPSLAPAFSGVFNEDHITHLLHPADVVVTPIGAGGVAVDVVAPILPGPSGARAQATVNVAPFGPLGPITGFVHTEGFVTLVGRATGQSFAYSSVTIRAARMMAGKLRWGPRISTTTSGGVGISEGSPVSATRLTDPIMFDAFDPDTGASLHTQFLDIEFTPLIGPSSLQWDSAAGIFQLNAAAPGSVADFLIDLPGIYTSSAGRLHLVTDDGKLVLAEHTGLFAGLVLPALGSPAAFGLPLGPLEFDYFVPFGGPNVQAGLLFAGGSQQAVPEPGILSLLAGLAAALLTRRRLRI